MAKGSWLLQRGFDPDLVERLSDFCEGFQGAPDCRIIAAALEHYMDHVYNEEPKVKERAEAARQKRLNRKVKA